MQINLTQLSPPAAAAPCKRLPALLIEQCFDHCVQIFGLVPCLCFAFWSPPRVVDSRAVLLSSCAPAEHVVITPERLLPQQLLLSGARLESSVFSAQFFKPRLFLRLPLESWHTHASHIRDREWSGDMEGAFMAHERWRRAELWEPVMWCFHLKSGDIQSLRDTPNKSAFTMMMTARICHRS